MTVFVVQKQMRWDERIGDLVPKYDLTPAAGFGKVEYLLSPTAAPFNPGPVVNELHEKLCNFSDKDHLLLIGNPCLIGFAVAVAADYNEGRVQLLQWSGKDKKYLSVQATLFSDLPAD